VYFSYETLTTAAYGDVTPLTPIARSAANVEGLTGQLFPAVLIARLVAMEIDSRRWRTGTRAGESRGSG
jgi:voltage-gated potassium channel Kch